MVQICIMLSISSTFQVNHNPYYRFTCSCKGAARLIIETLRALIICRIYEKTVELYAKVILDKTSKLLAAVNKLLVCIIFCNTFRPQIESYNILRCIVNFVINWLSVINQEARLHHIRFNCIISIWKQKAVSLFK